MSQASNTRQALLADQRQHLQELYWKRTSLNGVLLGSGWVVMPANVDMSITYVVKDLVATNPTLVPLVRAHCFSERDARALAATTTDGAGRQARAMHIQDAVALAITNTEAMIAKLEALASA